MKVVIKKTTNGLYRIAKETTLESIITDARIRALERLMNVDL